MTNETRIRQWIAAFEAELLRRTDGLADGDLTGVDRAARWMTEVHVWHPEPVEVADDVR